MSKNANTGNIALKNTCLALVRWGTYLVLFTPLIVVTASFFPFVTPKTIYFRIIVDVIFAAYVVLAIYFPEYRPKINFLSVSIMLFVGAFLLTSYMGVNFERSFWSTYERMTGVVTILHLFAFFIAVTGVFKTRKDWDILLGLSILIGIFICAHFLSGGYQNTRKGSTIGNSSFMATYLLFDVFFALILLMEKKNKFWKGFALTGLVFYLPVIYMASARAATTVALGGFALFGLGYLIFSEKKALRTTGYALIFGGAALVVALLLIQPAFVQDGIAWFQKAMLPRFVVWEKAWKGFLEKPIFGWGPENFNIVFLKFFNPCVFLNKCGGEVWFDRAHNIVFDTLSTMGIVGTVSYMLMMGAAFFGVLLAFNKKRKKAEESKSYYEMSLYPYLGMAVLLVAYFVQNLTVFDMISSYMIFFLSLAFIYFLIESNPVTQQIERGEGKTFDFLNNKIGTLLVLAIVIFGSSAVLYLTNMDPYHSATRIVDIIRAEDLAQKKELFEDALDTYMYKYETREQFTQQLLRETSTAGQKNKEVLEASLKLGEDEMEKSLRENSLDFRPHLFLGRLYSADYRATRDQTKLQAAERVLNKAIELSPTNQQGYWYMTEVRLAQGREEDAYDLFRKAIELEPELGLSYWYFGMTYKMRGEYQEALEQVSLAEENGYRWREQASGLKEVIDIHQALGNHQEAANLYEEAAEIEPDNVMIWVGLAQAYSNAGRVEEAREAALKAKELDPSIAPDIDTFLENLEN